VDIDNELAEAASAIASLRANGDATEGTARDVAQRFALATALKAECSALLDECSESLNDRMEGKTLHLPGVGLFQRGTKQRKRNRYDDTPDRLRSDVISAISGEVALDVASGEVDPMKRNVARAALDRIYEVMSVGAPKALARTSLGIAPDDYYEIDRVASVTFRAGIEEAS
jgi:hypothetical protein